MFLFQVINNHKRIGRAFFCLCLFSGCFVLFFPKITHERRKRQSSARISAVKELSKSIHYPVWVQKLTDGFREKYHWETINHATISQLLRNDDGAAGLSLDFLSHSVHHWLLMEDWIHMLHRICMDVSFILHKEGESTTREDGLMEGFSLSSFHRGMECWQRTKELQDTCWIFLTDLNSFLSDVVTP